MSLFTQIFGDDQIGAILGALGIGGAGGLLTKEAYERLGEIGEEGMDLGTLLAQAGLDQTQFQPFGLTTASGGMFSYDPETGQVTMRGSEEEQAFQQEMFSRAQSMMEEAGGAIDERTTELYETMRAGQRPEEERQRQQLEERLLAQGRLGVATEQYGSTPEQLAMAKAQEEAKSGAMMRSRQLAQGEAMQQFGMGQQMLGASYLPQQQLLAAQQASQLFPQLQQRGQLYGAGLYGEGMASGMDMLLASGLGQANLMGDLGAALLGGLFSGR